jgi:hypothetical protein
MQGFMAGLVIAGSARGLAVNRNELGACPASGDPRREACHEQVWINAIHQGAQPIDAGNAEVELGEPPAPSQKRQMGGAYLYFRKVVEQQA